MAKFVDHIMNTAWLPGPSPQVLACGNKASLFPSLVTEGDGKLESWVGPRNEARLSLCILIAPH